MPDINLNLHVNNLNQLNVFEQRALAAALAVQKLQAAGAQTGAFTNVERSANTTFAAIERGAQGVQQVLKNALGFSTSFLGFIVVNEVLKTFSAVTTGSVKVAADFETGMARVAKTTDLTANELKLLGNEFRDIAKSGPLTTKALLQAGEIAGQLGISGVENIKNFSNTVAELAVSTNLSVEAASTFLGRFQNITSLPSDKIENIASTVTDLGNKFASTESEIADFSLRLAGAGTTLGIKAQEIVGFGNALASVGLNAEAGGTAFSRVFLNIYSASVRGGEGLSKFAQVAGITSDQFKTLATNDPSQAVIKFIQGLAGIKNSGGDVISVLESLGLNNIRVRDALLRATEATGLFRESIREANREFAINSALGIEYARQAATTSSNTQRLVNNFQDLQIAVGSAFLPGIVASSQALDNFIQGLTGAQTGTSKLGDNFHNIFTTIQSGVSVLSTITGKVDGMSKSFGLLSSSINIATQAIAALAIWQLASGAGQFGGSVIGRGLGIAGPKAASELGIRSVNEGLLASQFLRTSSASGITGLEKNFGMGVPANLRWAFDVEQLNAGNTAFITQPGAKFPTFNSRLNRFQSPTGQIMKDADALTQINSVIIPEKNLITVSGLRKEVGLISTMRLAAGNALEKIGSFLTSGTGKLLTVVVGLAALNEVLSRTTGQGLLETFSSADEKAKAYNTTQTKLNATLDNFRSLVSSGKTTPLQAGNDIIKSSLIDINGLLEKQTTLQDKLGKTRGFGAPTIGGVVAGAGVGAGAGLFIGGPQGAAIGAGIGAAAGLIGSSFMSGRAQSAAIQGQINANREMIKQAASEFQITIADIEKIKIEFKNLGIDPEASADLKKQFQTIISDVTSGQFAQQLKQTDFAAEVLKKSLTAATTQKAGPVPSIPSAGAISVTTYTASEDAVKKFGDTVKLIFAETSLDQVNYDALVQKGVDLYINYPPILAAYKFALDAAKKSQEELVSGTFKKNPLIEGISGAAASQIDKMAASDVQKLTDSLKNGATQGLTLKDTLAGIKAPQGVKDTITLLSAVLGNANLTDDEITALITNFGKFGVTSGNVLKLILTGFSDADKAAKIFSGTLEGLKKFLGDMPSLADALTLSPDVLTMGAEAGLDAFIADANEQLTGIKIPDIVVHGLEGTKIQLATLSELGEKLNKVRDAALIEIKVKLGDSSAADELQKKLIDIENSFATSKLGKEQRIDAITDFTKLTELYANLKSNGELTVAVKAFLDEQFNKLQNWISGKGEKPVLIVDVKFNLVSAIQDLFTKLNELRKTPFSINVIANVLAKTAGQITAGREIQKSAFGPFGGIFDKISQVGQLAKEKLAANIESLGANADAASGASDKISQVNEDLIALSAAFAKFHEATGKGIDDFVGLLKFEEEKINLDKRLHDVTAGLITKQLEAADASFTLKQGLVSIAEHLLATGDSIQKFILDTSTAALEGFQSAFNAIFNKPTKEDSQLQLQLDQAKRRLLLAPGADEAAKKRMQAEVDRIQSLLNVRSNARDIKKDEAAIADTTALSDQDQLQQAELLIVAIGKQSAKVVENTGIVFLQSYAQIGLTNRLLDTTTAVEGLGDVANWVISQWDAVKGALAQGITIPSPAGGVGGNIQGLQGALESLYNLPDHGQSLLPQFASGIDRVPYDMTARIHQGERIIPASQNNGSGSTGGSGPTIYINITADSNASEESMKKLAKMVREETETALRKAAYRGSYITSGAYTPG